MYRLIERLCLIMERKDHLIRRLKGLSDDEKEEVIDFFKKKPNLENRINWNDKKLTFADFKKIMSATKTERKKRVKKLGIKGLSLGKDYLSLKLPEDSSFAAYAPLHHEASVLIASKKIGGCEGKWCIAQSKEISTWNSYVYLDELIPIYFVTSNDKIAVMIEKDFSINSIVGANDKKMSLASLCQRLGIKEVDFKKVISSNKKTFSKASRALDRDKPPLPSWFVDGLESGAIKVSADARYVSKDKDGLIWYRGTWEKGTWENGIWEGGTWKDGTWKSGNWEGGTWKGGVWEKGYWDEGVWEGGTWEKGYWENGRWENGTWKSGTWDSGSWHDGTWKKGTWKDGLWKAGKWLGGEWEEGLIYDPGRNEFIQSDVNPSVFLKR